MIDTLRRVFFTDLNNKVMALVLALLVWAYAFNNTGQTRQLRIRVDIVPEFPDQHIVVKRAIKYSGTSSQINTEFDGTVELLIAGQQSQLDELVGGHQHILKITESRDVNLLTLEYDFPPGCNVTKATPQLIEVEIQDRRQAGVAFNVSVRGTPMFPFESPDPGDLQIEPASLPITGPAPLVDAMEPIPLIVNVDGESGPNLEMKIPRPSLGAAAEGVEYDIGAPTEIRITATLTESKETRVLESVPVFWAVPPDVSVKVSNNTLESIEFQGPKDRLDALQAAHAEGKLYAVLKLSLVEESNAPVLFRSPDLVFPDGMLPDGVSISELKPGVPSYNWVYVEEKTEE